MLISRDRILNPEANTLYVVPAIAVSLFVFAYSTIFGQKAILLMYACWFPIFALSPELLTQGMRRVVPLLLLPGLALLSTLWSDVPSVTLRAAIQYGTTILCGLIAARLTSVPNLALGGMVGGLLILLYSFSEGEYGYDVVDGSYAFAGAFESKNQLGFYASLTIIFSAAIIMVFRTTLIWRLAAAATALLAVQALVMSDSATSIVTLAVAFIVIFGAWALFYLPPHLRSAAIVAIICITLALAGTAVRLGAVQAVFDIFGKDPTLTGRTFLWSQGIQFGAERPVLGVGYSGFWIHNRPAAEDLWQAFYIPGRQGFHFHNTLIEAYVTLGLVGVLLTGGLTLALLIMSFRVLQNRHFVGSGMVCAGIAIVFLVRSFVEIDFFTPYTTGSFLVPFLILHMADQRAAESKHLVLSPPPPRFSVDLVDHAG